MNLFVLLCVAGGLLVLLAILSRWQEHIEHVEKERVEAELREASERGSSRALTQFPQIDPGACIGCGTCIAACPEAGVLELIGGVARVVHGTRCLGHALCEDACPVGAIQVGLGDTSGRTDLPERDEHLESSVPGIFIAGELGGIGLIRNAIDEGARAVERIAVELREEGSENIPDHVTDVLIIGAGPAGFSATLKAVEKRLQYVTIDQDDVGGTVRKYPRRKLTLTGRMKLPLFGVVEQTEFLKEELIEFWEDIVREYGLEIHSGVKMTEVVREEDYFRATTSSGYVYARRIFLGLGRRGTPRKLGVSGEDTEKVLYQLIDAAEVNDERILVVGGGDSAIEAAMGLANQTGNEVTISYRGSSFFRLKQRNDERLQHYIDDGRIRVIYESNVLEITDDDVTLRVQEGGVERRTVLKNDFVYVLAGGEPPYPLLRSMGVRFGGDEAREGVHAALEADAGAEKLPSLIDLAERVANGQNDSEEDA